MVVHGLIHQFPREIKSIILAFIIILSIGFFGGIIFIDKTTNMQPGGIKTHYLGNENDEQVAVMKFKKNEQEVLTLVHNHIQSMSILFFLLALILATTSINKKVKYFLMIEPFFSIIFTFGGIYFLWKGILWFKYIILISGILMTLCFILSVLIIVSQIFAAKIKKLNF